MLTNKQAQCLDLIEKHWAEFGECPSYEDLLPALGLKSKSGVHRLLAALEERGFICRLPHRARAIEVLKPQSHLSAEYQRGFRDGAASERKSRRRGVPKTPEEHKAAIKRYLELMKEAQQISKDTAVYENAILSCTA